MSDQAVIDQFGFAVDADYRAEQNRILAEVELWRSTGAGTVGKHSHPWVHVAADHDVRVFFPDWQVGYLGWSYGQPEVMDSKGVEAGDTDSAWCETCGIELDEEVLGI